MNRHFRKFKEAPRASVLIEMIGTLLMSTALFASAFFFMTIFEVAQKQTMLVRTQAFLELGNYSTYGFQEHGQDDIEDDQSKVMFMLGENTAGTRVDVSALKNFDSFRGEMTIDVADSDSTNRFWSTFRFPTAKVRYTWTDVAQSDTLNLRNSDMPNHQVLGIVHNRSIDLSGEHSTEDLWDQETGIYTGSTRFSDLSALANTPELIGEGLIDNTSGIEAILSDIVQDDPSLAQAAQDLRSEISGTDAVLGGATASLISAAISNAISIASFAAAGGFSGAAQGGGFFQQVNLLDGAHLHNFGQLASFAGSAITTGAAVASAFGSYNEDLFKAGAVVSGVGAVASGASDLNKFASGSGSNGHSSGNEVYRNNEIVGGRSSQLFQGSSQILGGSSSILGAAGADEDLVFGLGAASAVTGFAGSVSSFGESLSGDDIFATYDENGNLSGSGAFKQFGEGGLVEWTDGKKWAATSAVGGIISGGAGLASMAGIQNDAVTGVGLLGAGVSLAGGAGSLAHNGLDFSSYESGLTSVAGVSGLAAGASGLTAGVATLAGADGLAESAGYVALGASAVSAAAGIGLAVSAVGKLAEKGADKVAGWFDGEEGPEGAEGSKVTPPDTRTATQKLEDGLNAVATIGNPAAAVASAVGAIGQASRAENAAIAAIREQEATEVAAAEAQRSAGEQQYQNTLDQIEASQSSAVAAASSASASSNSSGSRTQSRVSIINNMISEINRLDLAEVAAKLPPERAAQVQSAVNKIEQARARIKEAEDARLPPNDEDLEEIANAYSELQIALGEGSESYASVPPNGYQGNEGSLDVLGSSFRLSDLRYHQQNIANRMASSLRRHGPKETAKRMRQLKTFDVSLLFSTREQLQAVDRNMLEKVFDKKEAAFVDKSFDQLEKSFSRYEAQIADGVSVSQEEIQEDWALIQQIQAMVDEKNGLPPMNSQERKDYEEQKFIESLRLIEEEESKLSEELKRARVAYELVQRAESQVRFRPILVKNRAQLLAVQDVGYENAAVLAAFRDEYLEKGTEVYERFRAAEWTWTRMKFEYYGEYISRVKKEVKQVKDFVQSANQWAIENSHLIRQARVQAYRKKLRQQRVAESN